MSFPCFPSPPPPLSDNCKVFPEVSIHQVVDRRTVSVQEVRLNTGLGVKLIWHWLQEPAASTDVEAVFVVDGVEGKDGLVRAAEADAGVAAAASRLVASRAGRWTKVGGCGRRCWQELGGCGDWCRPELGRGQRGWRSGMSCRRWCGELTWICSGQL